jgi:serine protease Do
MNMKPFRSRLAVAMITAASIGGGYFGYNLFQNVQFARAEQKVEATREQLSQVENLSTVFRNVGKVVEPSVVNINVRKKVKGASARSAVPDDMLRRFFPDRNGDGEPDVPDGLGNGGGGGDMEQVGTGSGVIMEAGDGDAYIVTNNHVAGGAEEMVVTLSDGREISNGKTLGTDPKTDLAVVKIKADHVIPAKWGNSDTLNKGDWVIAFGSPFGYVGSMTHGIVSALNRQSNPHGGSGILGPGGYENFIQVDAPINPGNSGGPLVNVQGEVIGINTAIASQSGGFQGIGFAIPSNQAKFVYTALKEKGKVTRGWIGVSIENVSAEPDLAKSFGYQGTDGVLVQNTIQGTPAYGKLKEGDIVTAVNGTPAKDVLQLRNAIAATPPGSEVKLTVFRDGKSQDVSLKIGEQPEDIVAAARGGRGRGGAGGAGAGNTESPQVESLGMQLSDLTDERAQRLGLSDVKGALVTSVEPRSPASRQRISAGDVITRVNNTDVTSAAEAVAALSKTDVNKDGVRLRVATRDGSRLVFVKPNANGNGNSSTKEKEKE